MKIKNIKARYKLGAIFVMALLFLCVFEVASVDRTITDTSDTIVTYIMGSDGNYSSVTGANLQTMIDANQNGSVDLPAGYIDVSTDLTIGWCIVEGLGSGGYQGRAATQINLSNNATIQMSKGSYIRHLRVMVDVHHVEEAVNLTGGTNFWGHKGVLEDISIKRSSADLTKGIGFKIYAGNNSAIALCSFNDIWITGFEYAMWMESFEGQTGMSFINGNHFNSLFLSDSRYCLKMYEHGTGTGTGDIAMNSFNQLSLEPYGSSPYTDEGIIMTGYICYNNLLSVEAWDWHVCTGKIINITTTDVDYNHFQGYFKGGGDTYITDNGQGNAFFENKDIYAKEFQFSGNVTVDLNLTANKFIGDGGNITGLQTRIWNSNDNSWDATGPNIKLAYDDLGDSSGFVSLPNGTLTECPDIDLKNNTAIYGMGEGITVVEFASSADWGFNVIESAGSTPLRHNITLQGFTLDGLTNVNSTLYFNRCWDVNLLHLELNGSKKWNMYTEYYNGRFTMDHIHSHDTNNPSGNSFQLIGLANLQDSMITNIHCNGGDSVDMFDLTRSQNNTVRGVHISECFWDGMKLAGTTASPSKNNIIDGVFISGVKYDITEQGKGFYTAGSAAGALFDNHISNIHVEDGMFYINDLHRGTINKIHVNNSMTPVGGTMAGSGIVFKDSYGIMASNLYTNNCTWSGLYIEDSDNITISKAHIMDSAYKNVITGSRDIKISESDFLNGGNAGLAITDSHYLDILNCDISRNTNYGMYSDGTPFTNTTIFNTDFIANVGKGLDTGAGSHVKVVLCDFLRNTNDGLELDTVDYATVTLNTWLDNGVDNFDNNSLGSNNYIGNNLP